MTILITNPVSFDLPKNVFGWIGVFVFLGLTILLNRQWWSFNQPLIGWRRRTFLFLLLSVPITVLLLPSFQLPLNRPGFEIPLFAAVPLFLAAGFLGPASAAVLGLLSGLLIAIWGDHNLFFILELSFLSSWLGWMFFQEYRTPFFRGLRHPILAAIFIAIVYPFIYLIGSIILGQGSLALRIENTLSYTYSAALSLGLVFLFGGIIAEVAALRFKSYWGTQRSLQPSPGESKLSGRFLFIVIPLSLILLTILVIGDWVVAGRAARQMLEGRMSNAGDMTASSIPFVIETGQNLIISLADEPIYDQSGERVQEFLAAERPKIPYFSQLIYLDPEGNLIASDPGDAINSPDLSQGEINGVELASFVPIQIISTSPESGGTAALLSFIAGVRNTEGDLLGVIIGRSDLAANPFAKPLLSSIGSLSTVDGEGMLVDDNGLFLYHPDSSKIMTPYTGRRETTPQFFEATSPDGNRELVYYREVAGRCCGVIITVPAQYVQEQAINIAIPLLGIITILSIAAIFIFRFGLRSVTSSLQILAGEADHMAHGRLDNPLLSGGEDEVGQLRRAFEKMRTSLKSRLDELNRLLLVSQGIASTFEIEESLKPVLESALVTGATSARVYLIPYIIPNSEGGVDISHQYGSGPESDSYAFMDEQINALAEKQDILKLSNLTRPRIFTVPGDSTPPKAILAASLRHENLYYGTLWIGFDQPHQFSDEEVRYFVTLAGQAALAAANARLFLTAEIGRQRLEAILSSTPDPVLVTDQHENLLLTNPAAQRAFGLYDESITGKHISEVITHEEVLALLRSAEEHQQSSELNFDDGKTYLATASTVQVEGKPVGRVCILRDVSSFKQLDALKSEFVSTVSHDLRSPLALVQGYTSMLQMVGELNDQQTSYLNKIILETEKITLLITNLLDLGRIEAGVGLKLEKKSVEDVIYRVVAASQMQADQKRVNLNAEITQTNLPYIEADQALLQQALSNLVANGIKYTESGGEVTICLEADDEQAAYHVRDTGIGISPADQQHLFEKFYRVSNKGGPEDEGSGLGLAIVKSIAEKHGGHVHLESQLGAGSTFSLIIPLKQ